MVRSAITPWDHEQECVETIAKVRRQGQSRVLYVMASGLGKTFTSAFDYQNFRRSNERARFLFLAHQNDLLEQAQLSYQQVFGHGLTYGFFNGQVKAPNAEAVFATFQSMRSALFGKRRTGEHRPFGRQRFDYVVVDESHHGKAPTYEDVIGYFRPKFMLGMTATPNRMDRQDIREIFGPEVYSLELTEALASGLLTPVDYRIMADEIVDKGKIQIPPHLISIQMLNRIFFSRKRDKEIVQKILEKVSDVREPRIIVFSPSVKHAESFAKLMPGAVSIHSGVTPSVRQQRMELIRKGIVRTTVAVDQFNEGVDLPEANVLVFLRSTQSRTVFLQQLGRGLRKVPGKDKVLVLDFVANLERLAMLDQFTRDIKTREHKRGGERHEFHVKWGSVVFEERAKDVIDLLNKMQIGLTPEVLLDYLREFYQRTGRAPVLKDLTRANGMPGSLTYQTAFGNWGEALRQSGIPEQAFSPEQRSHLVRPGSLEEKKRDILSKLHDFYQRTGRAPTHRDLTTARGMPSRKSCLEAFGNWPEALHQASIPKEALSPEQRGMIMMGIPRSPDEKQHFLGLIRDFYQRTGRAPTKKDFIASKRFYCAAFGNWSEALLQSGIPEEAMSAAQRAHLPCTVKQHSKHSKKIERK